MKRQRDIERQLHTLRGLRETVSAMKSLAAHHLREARAALAPSRAYREGVERAVAEVGARLPAGEDGAGLLVIGAELGLCGPYNAEVARAAAEQRRTLGPGPTVCVGRRVASRLARFGVTAAAVHPGPTGVAGVTELLLQVAQELVERTLDERLASFDVVHTRFEGVGSGRTVVVRLLPMAVEAPPGLRTRYVSASTLARVAARELLYVRVHDALLEAMASEHGSRLMATRAAERWLDERTERLERRRTAARREATTQEMLEIAAGVRALAPAVEARGAALAGGDAAEPGPVRPR